MLFLFLFVSGGFGKDFGIPYLFLEPEYLSENSFWSMMLVGAALGAFIASYQIAMYILESYRFHFMAFEKRAFSWICFRQGARARSVRHRAAAG